WMSIVEGFGGMRVLNDQLCFAPKIPDQWKSYSFKINFRNQIITAHISADGNSFEITGNEPLTIQLNGKQVKLIPEETVKA
ncbi:glycosyl hydrolase family 65 protein, partial [Muricauda sp. ANG21]|uniref:glycosyl hydrolase family 65 protein n=1 Tax=Allomuricauda sp. ANG21 TaxID=3042468 RepID=UPI003454A3CA